jgi:hypothetical protein
MRQVAIYLLISASLVGCATSQKAPAYVAAPVPEVSSAHAVLYIYREYAEPTAFASWLQIDGHEVASLNQQGFTWVYVTPGNHKMKYGFPVLAGMPTVPFSHSFEAGKVYAFQMIGEINVKGSGYEAVSAVQPSEFEAAQKKMQACCRYVSARVKQ